MMPVFVITIGDIIGMIFLGFLVLLMVYVFIEEKVNQWKNRDKK